MDEFGVLTERFGLKSQGRGAPMAASKLPTNVNSAQTRNYGGLFGGIDEPKKYVGNSKSDGSSFDLDSIFTRSSNSGSNSTSFLGLDDDVFGKMPGSTSSVSGKMDDLFVSFSSPSNQGAPINDFLDDLRKNETRLQNPKRNELKSAAKNTLDFDELIPGFGGSNATSGVGSDRKLKSSTLASKSGFVSAEDPFVVLESTSTSTHASSEVFSDPLEQIYSVGSDRKLKSSTLASKSGFVSAEDPFVILESTSTSTHASSEVFSDPLEQINNYAGTKSGVSSSSSSFRVPPIPKPSAAADKGSNFSIIDELEHFAMGRMKNNSHEEKGKTSTSNTSKYSGATDPFGDSKQNLADDLDFLFDAGSRSRSVPKSRATNLDLLFDMHVNGRGPEVPKRTSFVSSTSIKKSSSATDIGDDFSFIFGASPVFGDLQEVDGEPEDRRKARLGRHQRTLARAAKAVEDMNRRDFENLQEQEEKRRIAESLDVQIKRWAAGKEGNMRALLSTLHQVLWRECDWQPVSLTDMITSASVKKVYRKATLCIHPDKVQQKGASIEHKYTAEKVFDVLKEAWNKFSKEELS